MTIALWGAVTGTLGLVLVGVRELLTYFPILRVRVSHGYELTKWHAGGADEPKLVRASLIVRVHNWSSRSVELAGRGVVLEDGRFVRFMPKMPAGFTSIEPYASATFAAPLVEILAVPGIDPASAVCIPLAVTSSGRIARGRPTPVVAAAPGLTVERVLADLADLEGECRIGEPSQLSAHAFAVTEAAPMSQSNEEAEALARRIAQETRRRRVLP